MPRRAIYARSLGPDATQVANSRFELGLALRALGRADEAEAHLRAARDAFRRTLGEEHPSIVEAETALGE